MNSDQSAPCVIKVEGLGKKYRLGVISRKMLVDQIESFVARKLGREDPHSRVFERNKDSMPTPYDFWALSDVSFEIRAGDVIGIMGRNGSGKSTLLKILSRITAPTKGTAKIKGRVASLLEVGTGFHPELTGRENVYLNGSILGLKQSEIEDRYQQIVDFSEISDFMDTPVKRYSSGMRVRLAFSVAAHLDPEILILDEVLAVGDAAFQEKCLEKIEATKKTGVTILFVSHSAESVRKLCTRGFVLQEGRLVYDGKVNDAVDFYTESLHLHGTGEAPHVLTNTKRSQLLGAISSFLSQSMQGGQVLVDLPVQTDDGIQIVDVGWVSDERKPSISGRQTFTAAPEICALLHDGSADRKAFLRKQWLLFKTGAAENWECAPDGTINVRTYAQTAGRLIPSMPERLPCG